MTSGARRLILYHSDRTSERLLDAELVSVGILQDHDVFTFVNHEGPEIGQSAAPRPIRQHPPPPRRSVPEPAHPYRDGSVTATGCLICPGDRPRRPAVRQPRVPTGGTSPPYRAPPPQHRPLPPTGAGGNRRSTSATTAANASSASSGAQTANDPADVSTSAAAAPTAARPSPSPTWSRRPCPNLTTPYHVVTADTPPPWTRPWCRPSLASGW